MKPHRQKTPWRPLCRFDSSVLKSQHRSGAASSLVGDRFEP